MTASSNYEPSASSTHTSLLSQPYSHLSLSGPDAFADICNGQYHWLRDFMFEHPEAEAILRATD